ncbi:ATP citrate (pro-S)-lyase, partial [Paragonimus westermani]
KFVPNAFLFEVGNVTGYLDRFIVEPFVPHDQSEEYYICIYTERERNVIMFYQEGGIDVGSIDEKAKRFYVSIDEMMHREESSQPICSAAQLLASSLFDGVIEEARRISTRYSIYTFTANPNIVSVWPYFDKILEAHIAQLDARTGASMKLSVLNPNGRIWTMSAGGGASVIYADTVCELAERLKQTGGGGLGASDLANYGEYSGAPSEGQTYEYAKTILSLMVRGDPHPDGKVLLIGGGIANFTNVAATFKGIVRALVQYKTELQLHKVRIFVRRAGPNYQEGLRIMCELGPTLGIPIHVFGPETHMTAIVSMAFGLREVSNPNLPHCTTPTESLLNSTIGVAGHLTEVGDLKVNGCEPNGSSNSTDVELFGANTRCIVWGLQIKAVQSMLDFDYASGRETPSVAALVYPFGESSQIKAYWGSKEVFFPVYKTLKEAIWKHQEASILVNFGSMRVAYDVAMEAMSVDQNHSKPSATCNGYCTSSAQLRCIAIIAEGIPENFTRRLICRAKERNVLLIGPATVGGVKAGCFKIGNTGGMVDNIIAARLYRPGSVAYVSRSGGMSNELNNIISMNSDGVEEGVAIGGDRYPGSTFLDHLLRYEANPNVSMMVMLGEVSAVQSYPDCLPSNTYHVALAKFRCLSRNCAAGLSVCQLHIRLRLSGVRLCVLSACQVGGTEEYAVAEAVQSGRIRKPIVAWCIGTCAQLLAGSSEGIQFGHAGACANSVRETATAKNAALAAARVHVPPSFDELDTMIRSVFDDLVKSGRVVPKPDRRPRPVPLDYSWAKELGLIRRPAAFTSTICDDRGSELLFAGVPITQVINENLGIGGVLGLLWFKRRLPPYVAKFLELCLIITADHGPAVSGALNTIVTARAGKDLLSSLTSGLLTIGDRFGGALDGAARQFSAAFDAGLTPAEFVTNERKASRLIMGIGHRVKSITNPDMRVKLLSEFVRQNFPATPLVDYAFAVEKVTTAKRPNLILNVDGMIGVAMVDLLRHCGHFTREEADEYMSIGTLNGLFVLGRSIGFIGHYLDQKRLHQGLYRHPWEDISYLIPGDAENGYQ